MLKTANFRKSTVIKKLTFDSPELTKMYANKPGIEFIQYIYESAKFVYIVEINTKTNTREYKTNFGFAHEPTKFHLAIEKYYFLGGV